MKKLSLFVLFLSCFSFSQNANIILQVNGEIIKSGFANIYLKIDSEGSSKKIDVDYVPGDLKLTYEFWSILKKEPEKKFLLHVDYYSYKKGKQEVANFDIELTKYQIEQRYLIADIYDFRDKSYKRKYQYATDKNYFVQFYWQPENGVHGIYAPMK